MKQYQKQQSKDLIKFNNNIQTSWTTLICLVAFAAIITIYLFASIKEYEFHLINNVEAAQIQSETSQNQDLRREIQIITTTEYNAQMARKQTILDLFECESEGDLQAIGDNGDSVGPFQWQKPTFDEKIGYTTTYQEYYNYVTDYEKIVVLTEKVFFDQGEWWRWKNCSYQIGYKK